MEKESLRLMIFFPQEARRQNPALDIELDEGEWVEENLFWDCTFELETLRNCNLGLQPKSANEAISNPATEEDPQQSKQLSVTLESESNQKTPFSDATKNPEPEVYIERKKEIIKNIFPGKPKNQNRETNR